MNTLKSETVKQTVFITDNKARQVMIYLSEREKGITKRLECDCWKCV